MDECAMYMVVILIFTLYKEITLKVQGSVTTQFCVGVVMVLLTLENFKKMYKMHEITQEL
jgi:prolipoprotein diacylglyceryltransferase